MCNFDKQNEASRAFLSLFMKKSAEALGGVNFLLNLIETMKTNKPNALLAKNKYIKSSEATIQWQKVVFKDKFDILEEVVRSHKSSEEPNFNILENESAKKAKKILNMVKTLAPIEFTITVNGLNDNEGFNFKIFDKVEDDYVSVNPIFVAMFFCSIDFTKKALAYKVD